MIDQWGNITLRRSADFSFPVVYKATDGSELDMSTMNLAFVVEGDANSGFTVTPTADPNNAKGKLIKLTKAHAASLGTKKVEFELRHTATNGDVTDLWTGTINAKGF